MIKAIVFDIDGTLTQDISWLKITELLGASVNKHEQIFELFVARKLPYEEAKRQLLELWQSTGNANQDYMSSMLNDWNIKQDAYDLVSYLQSNGYIMTLITGSVDLFADKIADKLGVESSYANTKLIWDRGLLVDFVYHRDQSTKKLEHFNDFINKNNLKASECIAIGDGNNEIELFKATGKGVAVGKVPEELKEVTWKHIQTLTEVIEFLKD